MSEATVRAFVVIPVPAPVRHALKGMQANFRDAGIRATWVPPENFHVTLRFLGNITYPQIDQLDETLSQTLAHCSAVRFSLEGAGVFPNLKRPSAVWAGLNTLGGDPDGVYTAADIAATSIGSTPEKRPFQPHVTLFRLRRGHAPQARLVEALAAVEARVADDFWADSVALWKSELRRGGAVYHQLKEYPLQCLPSNC